MSFKFKPEDFRMRPSDMDPLAPFTNSMEEEAMAARANGLLNAHLGTLPRVYGRHQLVAGKIWSETPEPGKGAGFDTQAALLWGVEPIEPCKHLNMENRDNHDHLSMISGGVPICPDCGARMKRVVTWEPVE